VGDGAQPTEAAPVRGVVGRVNSTSLFDLDRWPPSTAASRYVEHLWSVRWDLRGREPAPSTVITSFTAHHPRMGR